MPVTYPCQYLDRTGTRCPRKARDDKGVDTRCGFHRDRLSHTLCEEPGCTKFRRADALFRYCAEHVKSKALYATRLGPSGARLKAAVAKEVQAIMARKLAQ